MPHDTLSVIRALLTTLGTVNDARGGAGQTGGACPDLFLDCVLPVTLDAILKAQENPAQQPLRTTAILFKARGSSIACNVFQCFMIRIIFLAGLDCQGSI
jgi:hypothetical protein